jgi:hypothetical protein
MAEVWVHPTAVDVYTTWQVSDYVTLKKNTAGALVPVIAAGGLLRSWAGLILSLDAVARLDAYCVLDVSGAFPGFKHAAFENRDANPGYDVDQALARFVSGEPSATPDLRGTGAFRGYIDPFTRNPWGTVGGMWPAMQRRPSGDYSDAAAIHRGNLLNSARAIVQARSAAIDAGLAATCAANWAAKRAEVLAWAQATFPDRGYL